VAIKDWSDDDLALLRLKIAAQVLSGFAADSETATISYEELARVAVRWADALLHELDK
jgi:hypothetical protein